MKLQERISRKQIVDLEKFADKLLNKYNIDIEFTRHFVDRVNDERNDPDITIAELQKLFKKIAKNKGEKLKDEKWTQAVLKDISTDLNLPIVIEYIGGEFVVTHKTIMRKKNFKTPNKMITVEEFLTKESKNPCWKGYSMVGTKMKNGKKVPNCVKDEDLREHKDEGKYVGDWRITYVEPLQYDDYGAPYGGIVRIVNQNDFETLLIQNSLDLRSAYYFVSWRGKKYTDKNYINLIKKLKQ